MGLIGDFVRGAGDVITGVIPGTLDDRLWDAAKGAFGSGPRIPGLPGGSTGLTAPMPRMPQQPDDDDDDLVSWSPVDFGPVQVNPGAMFQGGDKNGGPPVKGFQNALMQTMLKGSIRSKSGRAMMEAMVSGSLQGGMIQQTTTVQTPRGVENHSPPGFRTVYVNDQPYAVFKPLAQALNLLPKESKAYITKAEMKTIRKADSLTKRVKGLAQKTGRLKCTNK